MMRECKFVVDRVLHEMPQGNSHGSEAAKFHLKRHENCLGFVMDDLKSASAAMSVGRVREVVRIGRRERRMESKIFICICICFDCLFGFRL